MSITYKIDFFLRQFDNCTRTPKGGENYAKRRWNSPAGFGPMSGRGAGYCAGYPTGYANPFLRGFRGRGRGFDLLVGGRGFYGRGRGFYAPGAPYWQQGGAYPFEPAPDYYDDYNPTMRQRHISAKLSY